MDTDRRIPRDDVARLLSLTKVALKDLAARDGTYWKEVVGELHSQNNEIPLWVLLYEDGDLLQSHAALCETLLPHMDGLAPLQIELFYEVFIGGNVMGDNLFWARLSGNDAILSAGASGKLELQWIQSHSNSIFKSRSSKRQGQERPVAKTFPQGTVHEAADDFQAAVRSDQKLLELWEKLTPLGRNEFLCWVEDAKQAATRRRRIARTCEELQEGKKRPCCWAGCIHRTDKAPSRWQQAVLIEGKKKGAS